ncbi:cell division protein FtsN [Tibeticola sediminis]|uniref:Cell division protein FtsN n=1 Tax=Tibeticola sediminis TaxID=1917811 RepID=A0A3N4U7R7_9BURK|nr:SPOR domain-containing protein [Tibeticola sediminis]RPE66783.1 cell division protein FtsN [Tibeticola sediminis]
MIVTQRGGTVLGFIVGVVVGLGLALAVAVYVMRVPVPFVDRGVVRKAEPEPPKAPNWNPNAPLAGRAGAITPAAPASAADPSQASPAPAAAPVTPPAAPPAAEAAARKDKETTPRESASPPAAKPAPGGDPIGELARERGAAAEPFSYFVQAGAFRSAEEAEAQRAKLGLQGIEAKVSEREQAGRTVYRVRVGPFDTRDAAERLKQRLDAGGFDAAIVRVQR